MPRIGHSKSARNYCTPPANFEVATCCSTLANKFYMLDVWDVGGGRKLERGDHDDPVDTDVGYEL